MMIGSAPDDITAMTLVTGIPQLDEALATGPGDGGVILVCGPTGGGKTVLAVQMAVNSALAGRAVWALMHETEQRNFHERAYSAACDEPYERVLRGLDFQDMGTGHIRLPVVDGGSSEFSIKALNLGQGLRGRLRLEFNLDLHQNPAHGIKAFIEGAEGMPEILIVDWLDATLDPGTGHDGRHHRMKRAMEYLRWLATDHGVLVVVFCQAKPKVAGACRNVFKTAVAEFPRIVDAADSFVGISQLARMPSEGGDGNWSEQQFLTVYPDARMETRITIPVHADFGFQRFLPRVEDNEDRRRLLAASGRHVRLSSDHQGWVRFHRSLLRKLSELGHPPSINVFVLLMLMANKESDEVFAGREMIAKATGLTGKQVRLALAKLENVGLLQRQGNHHRANKYVVRGLDRQDGDGFWFRLYRNLRDENRGQLLADPSLLRVWLLCLTSARYKIDADMEVERGSFLIEPRKMAETLGMTVAGFEDGLSGLERQGRIAMDPYPGCPGIQVASIVNWELYQDGWVDAGSRRSPDSGDEDLDEDDEPTGSGRSETDANTGVIMRAKSGPRQGQLRAKSGPSEGY